METIDILNDDGTLSKSAQLYVGKDRFEVRKEIAADLENGGHLVKTEEYQNKVGFSERTDAIIEPKLSMQWFCKMKEFSKPALKHVMNDDIKFHPAKFKNTYRHWMENIKDWCISRPILNRLEIKKCFSKVLLEIQARNQSRNACVTRLETHAPPG